MASPFLIAVPAGVGNIYRGLALFLLTMGPVSFFREATIASGYSKFFHGRQGASVTSRTGMTILYLPAFLVACVYSGVLGSVQGATASNMTGELLGLHFFKRLFEVFFIHRFSGSMQVEMFAPAGLYYALNTAIIAHWSHPAPLLSQSSIIGLSLFATGMVGNFYHHVLLRYLRKDGDKKYVVPKGGLFEYVACPHYFFEILIWLGVGVYGRVLIGYLPSFAMAGYLSGRAKKTTEFYLEKLGEEYPKDRKHIVPFVY